MTTPRNQVAPLELGLCVADLDTMVRFYVEALGCREMDRALLPADAVRRIGLGTAEVDIVWLQTEWGERLKLLRPHDPPQRHHSAAAEFSSLTRTTGVAYLTFYVRDADRWAERAFERGATALIEAWRTTSRIGATVAFFRDPEGNVVELVQRDDLENYRPDLFSEEGPTSSGPASNR